MKKIFIASLVCMVFSSVANADNAPAAASKNTFGIDCVRWSSNVAQINCGVNPWRRNAPAELSFSSVKDIYEQGYKVVSMNTVNDAYPYTEFVIEKQ